MIPMVYEHRPQSAEGSLERTMPISPNIVYITEYMGLFYITEYMVLFYISDYMGRFYIRDYIGLSYIRGYMALFNMKETIWECSTSETTRDILYQRLKKLFNITDNIGLFYIRDYMGLFYITDCMALFYLLSLIHI